ncbi:MAG: hypothetical protein K2X81_06705 [Candidatus Obscuribacterales bacterium]|nr:hypothetical protein [Candidatus Obscuribacterales bacterium]
MNWEGPNSDIVEPNPKGTKPKDSSGDQTKPSNSGDSHFPSATVSREITQRPETSQAQQAQLDQVRNSNSIGVVTSQAYKTPDGQSVQALHSYDQKTGQTITSLPKSDGQGWTQYVKDQNTLRPVDGGPVLKLTNDGYIRPDNTIAPPMAQKPDNNFSAQKPETTNIVPQTQRAAELPIQSAQTAHQIQAPVDSAIHQQQQVQASAFALGIEHNQTIISDPKVVAPIARAELPSVPVAEHKTAAAEFSNTITKPVVEMRPMEAPKMGLPNEPMAKAVETPSDKAVRSMVEDAQRFPIQAQALRSEPPQVSGQPKESTPVPHQVELATKRPDVIEQKQNLTEKPGSVDIKAALLGVIAAGKAGGGGGGGKASEVQVEKTPSSKPLGTVKTDNSAAHGADKNTPKMDGKSSDILPAAPHGKIESKLLAQLQDFKQERFHDIKTFGTRLISKFQDDKFQPSNIKEATLGKLFESMKPEHLTGLKNWLSGDMRNPLDFKMLDLKTQQTISKIFDLLGATKGEIRPQGSKDLEMNKETKPISKETEVTKPASKDMHGTKPDSKDTEVTKLASNGVEPIKPSSRDTHVAKPVGKDMEVTKPSIHTQTFAADSADRKPESKDAQLDTNTRPIADKEEDTQKKETRVMAQDLSPDLQKLLKAKQEEAEEEIAEKEEQQLRWDISLGKDSKYRVKAGDTLASIALTIFKKAELADCLFHYNKEDVFVARFENNLFTIVLKGKLLVIPSREMITSFERLGIARQSIQFDKQFENTIEGLVSIFGVDWRQVLAPGKLVTTKRRKLVRKTFSDPIEFGAKQRAIAIESEIITQRQSKDRKTKTVPSKQEE